MTPKKIHVLTRDLEILDAETTLTRAWVSLNPHKDRTEYTDLSHVWHDASEEAKQDKLLLVERECDRYGACRFSARCTEWKDFVLMIQMKRWLYVDDLLSK